MKLDANSLPLIVKKSRWLCVLPLIGSVVVAGIGGYALAEGKPSWIGWTVIVLFSGSAFYYLGRLLDGKLSMTITEVGICVDHWDSGTVSWDDFSGVSLITVNGVHWLCLTLREPEEYRRNAGAFRRAIHTASRQTGYGDFPVNLSAMGLEPAEVVALVGHQIDVAKTKPKQPGSSFRYPVVK